MTYLPTFQGQLQAGDPYGGLNCACYCGAMAADFMSGGRIKPTGRQVRAHSDEPIPDPSSPGLNLGQVNTSVVRLGGGPFAVHSSFTTSLSWQQVRDALAAGHGVHIAGWYEPIRQSPFRGSTVFGGNHGIFVAPGWIAMDPLADGRRPGIYQYHGASYPENLLRTFAGGLNVGGAGHYRALGFGQAWANVTGVPAPVAPPHGKEQPLNATTQKPVALCKVKAGGTVYADEKRTKVVAHSWAGGEAIQLYSRPVKPKDAQGRANLALIRWDTVSGPGENLSGVYVGDDLISDVRLAP